jgi:Rrf2 family iron-sulfur cluster assembly transcriptional regulator
MLICSRACAHAVKALVRLAREGAGVALKAREIAAKENIPYAFLAKVLHQLVRAGIVSSSPGLTGGFRLRLAPSEVALIQIVEAVDGLAQFRQCFTGIAECNELSPCPMHDSWQKVKEEILKYLRETTLAQVVEAWDKRARSEAGRVRVAGALASGAVGAGLAGQFAEQRVLDGERQGRVAEDADARAWDEIWDLRQPLD